jgi:hypothetical protein
VSSLPPPPPSPSCPPLPAAALGTHKEVPSNTLRMRNLIESCRLDPPPPLPQLSTQGESVRGRVEIRPIKPQRRSVSFCYVPRRTCGRQCCPSRRPSLVVVDLARCFLSLSLGKKERTERRHRVTDTHTHTGLHTHTQGRHRVTHNTRMHTQTQKDQTAVSRSLKRRQLERPLCPMPWGTWGIAVQT